MKSRDSLLRYPLPPNFLRKRLLPVVNLIESQASGLVLGCPGSGRTALLKYHFSTQKNTAVKRKAVFFSFSGVPVINFEELVDYFLAKFGKSMRSAGLLEKIGQLEEEIARIQKSETEFLVFVEKISDLEIGDFLIAAKFIKRLWEVPYKNKRKLKFFFLDDPKLIYRQDFELLEPLADKASNIVLLPFLSREEFLWHLERNARSHDLGFDKSLAEKAWSACGAIAKRGRELAFIIGDYSGQNASFSKFLLEEKRDYFVSGMKEIILSLGGDLEKELKKIIFSRRKPTKNEKAEYLKKLGLINDEGKFFASLVLLNFVFLGGEKATDEVLGLLSGREQEIWRVFKKEKGDLVTKEKLAEVIWGKNWEENYSEWAISKAITRLNKKLQEVYGYRLLACVRGKGYHLAG